MSAYLIIAGLLFAAPAASLTIKRFPIVVFAILGVAIAIPSINLSPVARLGGISIYFSDLVCLVCVLGLVGHLSQLRSNLRGATAPFLFVGLLIVSLLLGYKAYGQVAANQAREMLWLIAPSAYFLALDMRNWGHRLLKFVAGLAWLLVVVALINLARHGLGSASSGVIDPITGDFVSGRILNSSQNLIVVLGSLISFHEFDRTRRSPALVSALVLAVVAVLAQNRSAWVALIVGVVVLALASGRAFVNMLRRVTLVLVVGLLLTATTSPGREVAAKLGQSTASIALQNSTLAWRTEGWNLLVSQSIRMGPRTVIAGAPFGSSLSRTIAGQIVDTSPHNWYVLIYLRTGIVGLLLASFILVRSWRRGPLAGDIWLRRSLLAASLSFALAYSLDASVAPVLAVVIAGLPQREGRDLPAAVDQLSSETDWIKSNRVDSG